MGQERTFSMSPKNVRSFRSPLKPVKEHEAASFSLIASFGVIADIIRGAANCPLIAMCGAITPASAIERVVAFYNHRGTAEQYIKEGKHAIKWTRLSCRKFRNNVVRLQLHALAYSLANFMRTLALPEEVEHWSLTTLREKLVKIGAKVVRHGRYVTFQLAEIAVPRSWFQKILALIDDLRRRPVPA